MKMIMNILDDSHMVFNNHKSAAQSGDLEKHRKCPCLPKGTCTCS